MNETNVRALVLQVLTEVLDGDAHTDTALHALLSAHKELSSQEKRFLVRLTEGTVERKIELDYIIDQFSTVKINKMKKPIRNILRMGVYQICYMESVPDAAACNEAVKLAVKRKFNNLKGFVNGVLRSIARNRTQIAYPDKEKEPVRYLHICYSMPEWIVELFAGQYGMEKTEQILQSFLAETETVLVCNSNRITREEYRERLEKEGIQTRPDEVLPFALHIDSYNSIPELPGYKEGLFWVQDVASQLVGHLSGIRLHDKIVDVCAAPGGKSLYAAMLLEGTGSVLARDLTSYKVDKISENRDRLSFDNLHAEVWDALEFDETQEGKADVVIADLPCSGLGVIGKKSDIKYRMTAEGCKELAELQRKILTVVSRYLKSGGILLYSTCTLNPAENEENSLWIAKKLGLKPDLSIKEKLDLTTRGKTVNSSFNYSEVEKTGIQLLPDARKHDGFYIAKFVKS